MVEMTISENHRLIGDLKPGSHMHLVGIGGFGLSAIARVLLGKGFIVSGSDLQRNELTDELIEAGATVYIGHAPSNWLGADALLVSSAIPFTNPEVVSAREAGLPVVKRADLIGDLMGDSVGIAVAGSHGKTTTTGMIAQILVEAGLDPSVIVGGVLPLYGTNGHAGDGIHFVVEADEYDYMFLGLRPTISIITNIEFDHPDIFPSIDAYQQAFEQFANLTPEAGTLIVCMDDTNARQLVNEKSPPGVNIESYGLDMGKWRAVDLRQNQLGGLDFLVQRDGDTIGLARLRVPGEHNVLNALAAIIVANKVGIDFNAIRKGLAGFSGIGRRFQIIGEAGDVVIIDDYAHHPTEIRATLAAARQRYSDRRIWAVWQPHTYSRTKRLQDAFGSSFDDADFVIVLDIFRSREKDTLGIDADSVVDTIEHDNVGHIGGIEETVRYILDRVKPGDVIITLTAGDGNLVGKAVLEVLNDRVPNHGSAKGKTNGYTSSSDNFSIT
jgi:UDP-N-acetylmuramate--alanine ligase